MLGNELLSWKGQPRSPRLWALRAVSARKPRSELLLYHTVCIVYTSTRSEIGNGGFMILRRLSLTAILCGTFLLNACGFRYEWSHASALNTVAAYQKLLSKYPTAPHAVDARRRIATL